MPSFSRDQWFARVRPLEWMRLAGVVVLDVRQDLPRQLRLRGEVPPTEHPTLQDPKPQLHLVEPTAVFGRECTT